MNLSSIAESIDYQFRYSGQDLSISGFSSGASIGIQRKILQDCSLLPTQRGRELAEMLREILLALDYDTCNEMMRADYAASPLPLNSYAQIKYDINSLGQRLFDAEQINALRFFLLGEELSCEEFKGVIGARADAFLEAGVELGLLIRFGDKVSMNGFAVASRRQLQSGSNVCSEVLFVLADIPAYYKVGQYRQRVYSGVDSYLTNGRLIALGDVYGKVGEAGSGSGMQLISLLRRNSGIVKAIGLEIDERARNASVFNSYLNEVSDRFFVTGDPEEFRMATGKGRLSLAFSNPPFIALPAQVMIGSDEVARLPEDVLLLRSGYSLAVNMRQLYLRAGWGGEDGLAVTKDFISLLLPLLANDGRLVIFSQFAGDLHRPSKLYEMMDKFSGVTCQFEKLSDRVFNITRQEWAEIVARIVASDHPDFQGSCLIRRLQNETNEMLASQGIEMMHGGFLVAMNNSTTFKSGETFISENKYLPFDSLLPSARSPLRKVAEANML